MTPGRRSVRLGRRPLGRPSHGRRPRRGHAGRAPRRSTSDTSRTSSAGHAGRTDRPRGQGGHLSSQTPATGTPGENLRDLRGIHISADNARRLGHFLVDGYGSSLNARYDLHDDAFSSAVADASLTTSPTIRYANNVYGGAPLPVPATDTTARTGDPLLVNPAVSGPYGTADSGPRLRTALGFAPRPGSPLIGNGTVVPDNGGRDYRGAPLYRGRPDIGAVEGPPGGARAGHAPRLTLS
ncbi:hypothetical protein [Streptomyces melanosporofaciens]|uniref:Uncharacterized protein n=1 Tax=Streptomyces melanosporofaciens TaxID=67327 RepID=A0A1H5C518_STRMJ|nr:hypothetical protein [Streptomyces melanosporofaciens]SED61685.1 hypothetical protein SAMN04490356_9224 [Streptomyces melanosporofaciens]